MQIYNLETKRSHDCNSLTNFTEKNMKVSKSVHTRHVLNIPRYILRGMSIALWGRVTPNASSAGAFKPNELTFNTMFYDSVRLKSPHVRPSFQMRRL